MNHLQMYKDTYDKIPFERESLPYSRNLPFPKGETHTYISNVNIFVHKQNTYRRYWQETK